MADPVDMNFVTTDVLGGTWLQWADSFTDVKDLVDQIIAKLGPGQTIGRLAIAGHGAEGTEGFFVFDPDTTGAETVDGGSAGPRGRFPERVFGVRVEEQLARLRPYFDRNDGVVEFRVCEAGTGGKGDIFVQRIADIVGVPVTAPTDTIKALAAVGGLTTNWKTAQPSEVGTAPQTTFLRGEGGRPAVRPDGIAPVTGATVPLPGVATAPVAPTPVAGVARVSSGSPVWRRPAVIVPSVLAVGAGTALLLSGGGSSPDGFSPSPVASQRFVDPAPSDAVAPAPVLSDGFQPAVIIPSEMIDMADFAITMTAGPRDEFLAAAQPLIAANAFTHSDGELKATATGDVDLVGAVSFGFDLPADRSAELFGPGGPYECGAWNLCMDPSSLPSGNVQVIGFQVAAEPPADLGDWQYQYGIVLDIDGESGNNYAASSSFPKDTFDGTDRWYQVVAGEAYGAPKWNLRVDQMQGGSPTPAESNAILIQDGNAFVLVAQESEVPPTATFRVTSFRHTGDFGMQPPNDFSGDVFPEVGMPLAEFSGVRFP